MGTQLSDITLSCFSVWLIIFDHTGSFSSRWRGLVRPYFWHRSWTWLLHVVDVLSHIFRNYLTSPCTVVLGFAQILWNVIKVLIWSRASIGGSPSRKCSAGMGELLLSFRNPLSTLLWKVEIAFVLTGRIGREHNPERRTGRLYIFQRWTWTSGDSMHL